MLALKQKSYGATTADQWLINEEAKADQWLGNLETILQRPTQRTNEHWLSHKKAEESNAKANYWQKQRACQWLVNHTVKTHACTPPPNPNHGIKPPTP